MLKHEQVLQSIADANGGNRLAGTPGNDQTVAYVAATMTAAGWAVHKQPFEFPYFQELAPATFSQTAPTARSFNDGTDFATMTYSGSGDVTANVTAVGPLNVPIGSTPAGTTTSGCAASDFAGFPAANIALVQRGTCSFGVKAQNAKAAGASAVVVFNEGQPGRTAVVAGTLGAPVSIPALGATYQLGVDQDTAGASNCCSAEPPRTRPLLPPGLRHHQQPQPEGLRRDEGRRRRRPVPAHADSQPDHRRLPDQTRREAIHHHGLRPRLSRAMAKTGQAIWSTRRRRTGTLAYRFRPITRVIA
jgi:hypothetical protein